MTHTSDSIDWEQVARRVLKVILVFGAVVASFIFLTDLARQNGWPWYAALLLPMCIDALGGVALLEYRAGNTRGAGWVAAGAITASFVGNGLSHLYAADVITPTFVSIALIGGVPALSLGLAVHLNKRKADDAVPVDSDAGATDTNSDGPVPGMDSGHDTRAADADGSWDGGTGSASPAPRRRAPKTKSRTRTGGRGPTGPDVDTVAADIRRLGIHSKRAAKAHFGIGDDKVNQPVVVAALTANNNGH